MYLKRFCDTRQAERLGMSRSSCERMMLDDEGRAVVDRASSVYLSAQRQTVAPAAYSRAQSVRQKLAALLAKRDFVLYWDDKQDSPIRCLVYPAIMKDEAGAAWESAGYPSKMRDPRESFFSGFSLLTTTSKMGCFSWNSTAGPPDMMGTCRAAKLGYLYSKAEDVVRAQAMKTDPNITIDPESFICNACYATKGCYGNPSNVVGILARYMLANALLGVDGVRISEARRPRGVYAVPQPYCGQLMRAAKREQKKTGQTLGDIFVELAQQEGVLEKSRAGFVDVMVVAIEQAQQRIDEKRKKLKAFGFTVAEFSQAEAQAKGFEQAREQWTQAKPPSKSALAEWRASRPQPIEKMYAWALPDPGYFRIHDSGDMYNDAYFQAWLKICRELPSVRFWAPTRMWVVERGLKLSSVMSVPENLALRPSSLHFSEIAPTLDYLSSLGLPVYEPGVGGGYSAASGSAPDAPTKQDWKCPAYEHWTKDGGAIRRLRPGSEKGVGGTCVTARGPRGEKGCRVCWGGKRGEYSDVTVFYEEH
jgi:hypothetical protein